MQFQFCDLFRLFCFPGLICDRKYRFGSNWLALYSPRNPTLWMSYTTEHFWDPRLSYNFPRGLQFAPLAFTRSKTHTWEDPTDFLYCQEQIGRCYCLHCRFVANFHWKSWTILVYQFHCRKWTLGCGVTQSFYSRCCRLDSLLLRCRGDSLPPTVPLQSVKCRITWTHRQPQHPRTLPL